MNKGLICLGVLMLLSGKVQAHNNGARHEKEKNSHELTNANPPRRFSLDYINQTLQLPHLAQNKPQEEPQNNFLNCYSAKKIAYSKR